MTKPIKIKLRKAGASYRAEIYFNELSAGAGRGGFKTPDEAMKWALDIPARIRDMSSTQKLFGHGKAHAALEKKYKNMTPKQAVKIADITK